MNPETHAAPSDFAKQLPATIGTMAARGREVSTLVELLRARALRQSELRLYTYLNEGEGAGTNLTLGDLERRARAIGALLQSYGARGERALLLYPAGLEFIPAFFGCLYGGVIAVPLPPPNIAQPQRTLPRLRTIISDARPMVALTTQSMVTRLESLIAQTPELQSMRWLATDQVDDAAAPDWRDPEATSNTLALLQYTSGSTATPRGVMVTHGNLIENSAHIDRAFEITAESVSVTWLPVFHDMGLNNALIQPLYRGDRCVLMPPQSFLQQPARWLQAVSDWRATISGGPNFAFEMCVRKVTAEQCNGLDLSNWKVAYSGAEPIRAETLKRFAATFAPCGFHPRSFFPCYGLAEATLIVSGGRVGDEPLLYTTEVAALEHHGVVEAADQRVRVRTLVGCGHALADTGIVIVDPESLIACAPHEVGEIWVSAATVAAGYWNRPEETELTFQARLVPTGEGPFLRTGDLGFLRDGELYITGRLKDLIIIAGRNLYPHDIELTVETSHPALRPGCCAAFAVDIADEERLIVAAEVERRYQPPQPRPTSGASREHANGTQFRGRPPAVLDTMVRAVRRAVAEEHDVRVHAVVLLRAGALPKTPSGKVQRRVCQTRFRDGTLEDLTKNY
jgi:acyl-CoA synthetase (AMP-forming)/AMP-acid ligase II